VVTSQVRPDKLSVISDRIQSLNLEHIGNVPRDPVIEDAILAGQPLLPLTESTATEAIAKIMETLKGADS
jgi:CO dehydrogenase nickel-insertion accessory protein CooC1